MLNDKEFFTPCTTDLLTWIIDSEPVGRKIEIWMINRRVLTGIFLGYLEVGQIIYLQIKDSTNETMTFINSKNITSFSFFSEEI